MRRCRLRGIKRRIGADEVHVGTRHAQQHWEELRENRSQIRRSNILRSLDVLLSQITQDRQGGDAFKAAGSFHGERKRRQHNTTIHSRPCEQRLQTGNTAQCGRSSAEVCGDQESKTYLRSSLTDSGRGRDKGKHIHGP